MLYTIYVGMTRNIQRYVGAALCITLVASTIFLLGSASKRETASSAFTPLEAQAAALITVSQPPYPMPPAGVSTISKTATASPFSVAQAQVDPKTLPAECEGKESTNFSCYENLYRILVKEKGTPAAFRDLKARYEVNPYVKSQCHPLTHVIGRVAAESFQNGADAYTKGDNFCWSGYYHGVLETFVGRIGLKNLSKKIDSVCQSLNADKRYSFDYFNCVHGLGHGLMAITDDELYQSLNYCDSLTGEWEQQSCAGGVFMENIIVDGLNHVTKYLDPKRPQFPCDGSPDKYKSACYIMQTSYMLKINGGDFSQTYAWCRDAGKYQETCDQSLGRDASGRSVSDGPKTHDLCMLGSDLVERKNCVIGAVKDFISYFHSDKPAAAFCALFQDASLKTTCTDTAKEYYKSF